MEERIMVCAEELKKLKELLDNNIITQEEFEEKKKQLLSGSGALTQEEFDEKKKQILGL
jgi:hypothetical protein